MPTTAAQRRQQDFNELMEELGLATKTDKQDAMQDMKRAAIAVFIWKPGIEENIQAAAFLGAAALMEKKIILLAQNNVDIPEKVYYLADKVIRSDDPLSVVERVGDWAAGMGVSEDAPIVVNP